MSNNNIILELSNKSAQTQINNGDFETAFQPITINNGDVIQIKNAFIDSIQQSYDQIYLPNDVSFSLTFCFYEMDNPIFAGIDTKTYQYSLFGSTRLPNYQMYLMATLTQGLPFIPTSTINGLLQKGLYTTNSLVVEINRQLVAFNGSNPFIRLCNDGQSGSLTSRNKFLRFNVDPDPTKCTLDNNDSYQYIAKGHQPQIQYVFPGIFIGAREAALTFDDDGDNKFKFKFLHTPYYDDEGNMAVTFGDNIPTTPVTRDCGILLLDLQPRDFWTSLGFNVDEITLKLSSLNFTAGPIGQQGIPPQVLYFDSTKAITEGFMTIDDAFGNSFGAQGSGSKARQENYGAVKVSNNTRPISASQFFSFRKLCPFLMIEFLTNFNNTYLTGNESSKFITAIVSRNYTTNNYITGYSDSSIVYQHKGEPFLLSSIRTRIVNPDTKEVADDVGENNYIIVQIIKNNSQ